MILTLCNDATHTELGDSWNCAPDSLSLSQRRRYFSTTSTTTASYKQNATKPFPFHLASSGLDDVTRVIPQILHSTNHYVISMKIPQLTRRLNITFFALIWIWKHVTIDAAYQRGTGTGFSPFFQVIFRFFSDYFTFKKSI
jgi:hypothetical protein